VYGTLGTVHCVHGYGTLGTVHCVHGYGTLGTWVQYGYGAGTVGVRYVGTVCRYGTWVRYMGHLRGCGARVHVIKLAPANCSSTDIVWDGLGWGGKGSAHFLGYS
jgi:hypothetical protein